MNVKQIGESIYYAGVNDRTTTLFEGLWSLPYGVSYNSYIIRGAKHTALIDTVLLGELDRLLDNLESTNTAPDYLIIHHMEPDHSGSIQGLLLKYPNIKIVTNRIAIGMIKGFYHIDNPDTFLEVKDGDTLDLGGGVVLRFVFTPMVHWPETMMSYYEKEHTLFSGDAFGTFGALNGSPHDKDCDFELFQGEMRRYYASIVGKYSPAVRKAFEKLEGLQIERICSTHGPIWERYVSEVITIYDRMSKQEGEDGVVIVYGSMYGNTERMVNKFANFLEDIEINVKRIYNAGTTDLSLILADVWRYRGLVIAAPTYSMEIFPPVETFIRALEIRGVKNKVVAALGSYAWAPKLAAEKIVERMEKLDVKVTGRVAMLMSLNRSTEEELTTLAEAFSKDLSQ